LPVVEHFQQCNYLILSKELAIYLSKNEGILLVVTILFKDRQFQQMVNNKFHLILKQISLYISLLQ